MGAVEELVYLLNEAFEGRGIESSNESQSLVANLATVDASMWRKVPRGGVRTIEAMALHVGSCKLMYDDFAFGSGKLGWDDPDVKPWGDKEAPMDDVIEWLRGVHDRFVLHVADLSDADLAAPRPANWGELRETRWLISMILQHDAYHAGEINHIRSLFAGSDRWRW
jgi:hypothetical protein